MKGTIENGPGVTVFSNTTPFMALGSAGLLNCLPTIFGEVHVGQYAG